MHFKLTFSKFAFVLGQNEEDQVSPFGSSSPPTRSVQPVACPRQQRARGSSATGSALAAAPAQPAQRKAGEHQLCQYLLNHDQTKCLLLTNIDLVESCFELSNRPVFQTLP